MRIGALIAAALALVSTTALAQVVSVTGGQIRGVLLEQGGAVFKGIPYAAPPVEELRWREPAPVKRWTVWPKTWVISISSIIESWKDVTPCQNLASGLERRF